MRGDLPLDTRATKATLTDRNLITERYEGMIVYVISEQKSYQLVGGVTDNDWRVVTADAVDHIDFSTSPVLTPNVEGRLQWNNVDGTLDLGMESGNVKLQIGQETFIRVYNNTGAPMYNGQPVYINGQFNGIATCALAYSLSEAISELVVGLLTMDIAHGSAGLCTARGMVRDINTVAFTAGDVVYVGETPGSLTSAVVDVHAHKIAIGRVIVSNATTGSILCTGVRVSHPKELDNHITGFHIIHRSQMSFVNGTRTFTIEPINLALGYDFYQAGQQYWKYAAETKQITDVEGTHYIAYNNGVLVELVNPSKQQVLDAIEGLALITQIYWDKDNQEAILFSEERHGFVMDGETHAYLHMVNGPQWFSGMLLNGIVPGVGTLATDAQFGVDAGMFLDEDLDLPTDAKVSTVGLPIFYKSGASDYLRRKTNAGYSVLTDAAIGGITGRLVYNKLTIGVWSLAVLPTGHYVCCHVFATNDHLQPYVSFVGNTDYANIGDAQTGAASEITAIANSLVSKEYLPVATLIFSTADGYVNPVKAKIELVAPGSYWLDWRSTNSGLAAAAAPGDHNSTSGKQGGVGVDFFHLGAAQHTVATQAATAGLNGYLTSANWTAFNNKENGLGFPVGNGYILESTILGARTWVPKPISMVFPPAGIPISTGAAWSPSIVDNSSAWNAAQPGSLNLTSLTGLVFASTSFVKMTAPNIFALDINTYSVSSHLHTGVYAPVIHNLIDTTNHPVTGLTLGDFMRATSPTTYGFSTVTASTIGAATTIHNLIDTTNHPVTGLVAGQLIKATAATTYAFGYDTQFNASVTNQTGFAADTYLIGSAIAIPNSSLRAKSRYRLRFAMTKTAAGVAALVVTVRFGTNGTVADTALLTFTSPTTQTAHIDTATFDLEISFRTVGSGTAAVISGWLTAGKDNTTANRGHFLVAQYVAQGVSAGFDSTVSNSIIGVSYNGGAAYSGTCSIVDATLENLI